MLVVDAVFGLLGAVCFAVVVLYAREAYHNICTHQQISLAMLFLHDRSILAFQLLALSLLTYAVGMGVLTLAVVFPGGPWYALGTAVTLLAVAGLTLFARNMAQVTRKPAAIPETYPLELRIVDWQLQTVATSVTTAKEYFRSVRDWYNDRLPD